jgi:hypothetical protein
MSEPTLVTYTRLTDKYIIRLEVIEGDNVAWPVSAAWDDKEWDAISKEEPVPYWVVAAMAEIINTECDPDSYTPMTDLDPDDLAAISPWLGGGEKNETEPNE